MSFETYGLPEEKYLQFFEEEAELHCKALNILHAVAERNNIDLSGTDSKFIWELFQSCSYNADDKCRVLQKEQDPDEVKRRFWDPIITPSRDEMMEEIKATKELVEKLLPTD